MRISHPPKKKPACAGLLLPVERLLLRALDEVGISVEARPRRARGMPVLFPLQARLAAVAGVVGLQLALDLVERAPFVARTAFPAGAVPGMVVRERVAALVIRLALVVLGPIRLLGGRVDHLGDAFAGQAADHRADSRARDRTDRSGNGSYGSARRHSAGRRAQAGADRMCARRSRDRIAVLVLAPLFFSPALLRVSRASFFGHFRSF